jgi:hypothetical protein
MWEIFYQHPEKRFQSVCLPVYPGCMPQAAAGYIRFGLKLINCINKLNIICLTSIQCEITNGFHDRPLAVFLLLHEHIKVPILTYKTYKT